MAADTPDQKAETLGPAAPDAVITRLLRTAGPAAAWRGTDGTSFEPTGPVLANWAMKAMGLLGDLAVGPDLPLLLVAPRGEVHWRALCFALAAWELGATVVFVDPTARHDHAELPEPAIALAPESWEDDGTTESADEVLVYPEAPLALAATVAPGFTDAAGAVRAYPDRCALPRVARLRCTVAGIGTYQTGEAAAGSAPRHVPEAPAWRGIPRDADELLALLSALGTEQVALGARPA